MHFVSLGSRIDRVRSSCPDRRIPRRSTGGNYSGSLTSLISFPLHFCFISCDKLSFLPLSNFPTVLVLIPLILLQIVLFLFPISFTTKRGQYISVS